MLSIAGTKGDDYVVAEARFELAQALIETGGDRPRAVLLGRQAREQYERIKDTRSVAAVDQWLARLP